MLGQIMESFFSKVLEKLVDHGLDALGKKTIYHSTLETLERNLKALSAKASDIGDEIKNTELSGKKKRKREVEGWLEQVKVIESEFCTLESEVQSEGFVSRFLNGDQAKKLNEKVAELVEQTRHFGELVLDVDKTKGEALLTTRLVGKAFEENLERIRKLVVVDKVSSIGIYGMGGVGKTTLAKHINNRLLEETQECVFWVTVSQESSVRMLQEKIAHVIGIDLSDEYDEDKRAARLHRALSSLRKNIVLILDDVWRNICLEKVGDPLSVEGCRLILTTRSLEVCRQIGCQEVIAVKTLDTDEAWNLFSERLGREMTLPPQVEAIAKSMAKVCDGLPLGIITIAGSMRGETAIHVWRNALAELQISVTGHDEMEDHVVKVLKYSFDRLDPKHQRQGETNGGYTILQLCFLYCCLYPEDDQISRDELVRKFISEEFLDKRKSRKAQVDQGHAILDKLANVCLLESCDDDLYVKMHDLVRAMALKITQGKNMVIAQRCYSLKQIPNEEEYWMKNLEAMSLMYNSIEEIPVGMSPNCPKLSTLLLQGNPLKFIPSSFFSQMHGLCILDLSRTLIQALPDSLSDLEKLKALLLRCCKELVEVPYLGKLKALKELDLSYTRIREVPQGTKELTNLKFMSIYGALLLEMLPPGLLLNFPYLQSLHLPCVIQTPVEEIKKLKQLEEFRGRVEDACGFNRFIRYRESKLSSIMYCILVGRGNYKYGEVSHEDQNMNKNKLDVRKYNLKDGDGGKDVIMLAQDVQCLKFDECDGMSTCLSDYFPRFNNPKSLQTLETHKCGGVECILTNEQFLMEHEKLESCLQNLEEIELSCLPDFMGIIYKREITGVAKAVVSPPPAQLPVIFSSLRRLTLRACNKMKKLDLPLLEFQKLEEIMIVDCEGIEEIVQVENDDDARGRVVPVPKLRSLVLASLPSLESICKATMSCSSIETIQFWKCPAVKKLPLFFPLNGPHSTYVYSPPPALKAIKMGRGDRQWWESLEWEHPTHKHILQPFVYSDGFD